MTVPPAYVIAPFSGNSVHENDVITRYALFGFSKKRAHYWIREFIELGWIKALDGGFYEIDLPRTVVDKALKKNGGSA